MQIMLGFVLLLFLLAFIIFKVNKTFGKKEILILMSVVILTIIAYLSYNKKEEEFFPNMFKEKYLQTKNIAIQKLSWELLNNKQVSSKDRYIYKFIYIINKSDKTYICTAPKVEINKIGDEYIFTNFMHLEEQCIEQ
ncbi:MAG: hypothetical protein ACNI3C_00280 [Candidatus Marinarcus sp.]|uniref:hypothetical protein n=1 Tax=Candidatus Marinarcus sp. TaxID=3100987 RepID=UPI003AFFE9E7